MKKTILISLCLLFIISFPMVYGQTPYNPQALQFFASSLENLMMGRYEEAITDSTAVLRIDPRSSVSFTVRARAHYELGNYETSIADATNAIRVDRNNISAFNIRANSHIKRGEYDRAIADWRSVLRINPGNVDAELNIQRAQAQSPR